MNPRSAAPRHTALILASSIASLLTALPASAATYFWDSDGDTAGFGNTTGTWGTDAFWTTVTTGGATHSAVTATLAADIVNFGAPALNYANGGVSMDAGGVTATSIVIGLGQTTALTLASGGGSITLGGSTRSIIVNSTGHAINAPIILTGTSTVSFGRNTNVAGSFTLGGGMSGTGGVTFTTPNAASGNNQQTINLGAASTYTGNTTMTTAAASGGTIDNSTTIKNTSGAANALPVGTVLSLTGGNGGGSGRSVNFDLGGQNQTLAGLQNTVANLRNQRVTNSGALATLTINNSANYTYGGYFDSTTDTSGQITGAIALAKSGTGTFTLDATLGNTYTGGTTISGTGKLIAQGSNTALGNAAGVVDVGSTASLRFNNNLAVAGSLSIANAITGSGTLEIAASNAPSSSDLNRTSTGVLTGFTGNISVLANGNYLIGAAANVTTNQNLTIAAGGYMSTGESTGFGKLDGGGTIFRNAAANTRTLTLGNGDATGGNFSGVIRGESTTVTGLFNSLGMIAVTKVGSGTQTLSGVNTYGGNTTVSRGILTLSGAASALNANVSNDASTVTIAASGATLDLTYIGTDTVDKLFIGASQLAAGVYGPSATSIPQITGTGTLTVTSGPGGSTYASWASANGITGQPADGDVDNDGLENAVEMVVGGNPATQSDTDKLPTLALVTDPAGVPAGNYLEFTFRRSDASVAAGVTAVGEYDTDLVGPWTTAVDGVNGVEIIETSDHYAIGIDRVQVYVPRGAHTKLFGRLDVVVP